MGSQGLKYGRDEALSDEPRMPRSLQMVVVERERKRRRLLCDSIRHSWRLDDHTTYIRVRLISRIGFYLTRQEAEGLDYDSDETISFETGLPRSLEMVVDERERKKQRAMLDILQSVR